MPLIPAPWSLFIQLRLLEMNVYDEAAAQLGMAIESAEHLQVCFEHLLAQLALGSGALQACEC